MKRVARRDSPVHKRYRHDSGSNGRDLNSYREYGDSGGRSRQMQQSPVYDRHSQRPGSSYSRSSRDYADSGRQGTSSSYHSGHSMRRFSQRSSGSSGNMRSSESYNQSGRFLQGLVSGSELFGQGTKIDPVFAAAAAAALNATSNSGMYPQNTSATVAAVATAAMNAAALAAALGGASSQPNGGSGFQLPGLASQSHSKSGGNRSPPSYDRRGGNGGFRGDRSRDRDSSSYRHDNSRRGPVSTVSGHPTPEDDPTATRTIFVGNLPPDIRSSELRQLFEVYGILEDVDIKRPQSSSSNDQTYAFLRYVNVSMAFRAKLSMSGRRIAGYVCKIGYGKIVPTRCLWVGGLGTWTNYPTFAAYVERVSRPKKIVWPSGKNYANILYPSVEAASAAANVLRGCQLGSSGHRLRVDFTDESHMLMSGTIDSLRRGRVDRPAMSRDGGGGYRSRREPSRKQRNSSRSPIRAHHSDRRSSSCSSRGAGKNGGNSGVGGGVRSSNRSTATLRSRTHSRSSRSERSRSPSSRGSSLGAGPGDDTDQITLEPTCATIEEVAARLPGPVWKAVFALKKSTFSCRLLAVSGDLVLADQIFPRQRPKPPQTPPDDEDEPSTDATATGDNQETGNHPAEANEKAASVTEEGSNGASSALSPVLRISQRMKMDPLKVDDVRKRMKALGTTGYCVLLATESAVALSGDSSAGESDNHNRPIGDLINYLASKEAAGVVVMNSELDIHDGEQKPSGDSAEHHSGVMYVLPPGDFAVSLLAEAGTPSLAEKRVEFAEKYLIILLLKNTGSL